MTYRISQKLVYIKNNNNIALNRRYFIMGNIYKIQAISNEHLVVISEKNTFSIFKIDIVSQYFKLYELNTNIKVL
jgi:hypothetical protein